jgi:hypothetical protein
MSQHPPNAPFLPPTVEPTAADQSTPGDVTGPGGGDVTIVDTGLPFTGSVFTAPIAILGLVLTFAGWALLRLGLRED